jgi:PAS domain S-box-containing protein
VAGVAVHQGTPRSWQPDEVELVELVAGRCWESIERARAIRNLQENEQRQRFVMDSMPQKIFTAKPDGEDSYFNPQWAKFTGLSVERMLGWGWTQFIHPDDLEENLKTWRHAIDTGEPFQFEHRFRGRDGGYRWHMSRALPMRDAQGNIVMWVGSSTDIHDLRQAKEELVRLTAESERQRRLYETIHNTTPDFVYIFDLDHRIAYANRALLEMWGRTAEDALGKNCLELGYPDWHAAMHDRELEQVKATKQPIRGEVPFNGTQGRRIYDYIFVPVLNAAGEVEAIAGTTRDVTERKQAEESTHRRSEQVRRLAEVAVRISAAHDVDSVMRIVTEEARNLVGAHQSLTSFAMNDDWAQAIYVVSMTDKYGSWRNYDAQAEGAGIYSLVCSMNKPMRLTQAELEAHPAWKAFGAESGKHPPLRGWLAAPLVGRDGRNIGLIQLSDKYQGEFTGDDEAVLVQMAQMASVAVENARLVEDLREASRRKDEFLATLAHELRNPLAPLRNMLEVIKRTDGDRELMQQAHTMMERQLAHMVRLIDDLLDVSRVSRGKLELRCERVELSSVIAQAVESCRSLIDDAGHEFSINLPSRPVYLHADPVRLEQIFDNLLNNACKYTEPGGRISLTVECRGREVTIRVKDTGIGIPPDQLGGIFEMFAQVDNSLERLQGGLGIGLTLVRQLVEMHDGTVTAHSDGPGHGSEFVVCLPTVNEEQALDGHSPPVGGAPQMQPRRILVVDDNRDSAESLAMLLEMTGNQVEVAYDGLTAVKMAERFQPDLVLLDIGLPVLNGYDACRQIRRQPWGKDMVIVAVSGWGQEQDRLRSRDAGFDRHVVKPVSREALAELLA